jgi:Domain of unknown function (DUF5753)
LAQQLAALRVDDDQRVGEPGPRGCDQLDAGVEGPITVYEFDDAPSVVYTECYGGGRIVEDRQEVGDLVTVMSLIRSCALSPADSMELIRDIRRDHEQ